MDNRLYWIWMQQALGQGSPKAAPLLRELETPARVYEADDRFYRDIGLAKAERVALNDKSLETAEKILEQSLSGNGWIVTPDDAVYPEPLREIYELPLVLYGRGDLPELQDRPVLAMVGTRKSTLYGRETGRAIARSVAAAGMIVFGGGAVGIDAACHMGALEAGGITIAVQGCGLDVNYPRENAAMRSRILEQGGALLSEYPAGSPPWPAHFPVRNRIMSGLAQGVCVVEAPAHSGSLITAARAREQGRDVMAVPGPAGMPAYAGCNRLIQKGAYLVDGGIDVLRQYRDRFGDMLDMEAAKAVTVPSWKALQPVRPVKPERQGRPSPFGIKKAKKTPPTPPPDPQAQLAEVSQEARRLYGLLEQTPRSVDWLSEKAEMTAARALAALTELEIAGAARGYAGHQYGRLPADDE